MVLSDDHNSVGRDGIEMEELRRQYTNERVEKAISNWLITTVTYMPVLTQIISDGSPAGAAIRDDLS